MNDIGLDSTFFIHPKIRMLEKRRGLYGLVCFLRLWHWAANNLYKPYSFGNHTAEYISMAGSWTNDPDTFVNTLIEIELLGIDEAGCHYLVTDDVPVYVINAED